MGNPQFDGGEGGGGGGGGAGKACLHGVPKIDTP